MASLEVRGNKPARLAPIPVTVWLKVSFEAGAEGSNREKSSRSKQKNLAS
jgi:hypothetical protein